MSAPGGQPVTSPQENLAVISPSLSSSSEVLIRVTEGLSYAGLGVGLNDPYGYLLTQDIL